MKVTLEYTGGKQGASWQAKTESGHQLVLDGSPDIGGQDLGPRPMELTLISLAGCSSMDVLHILRKGRAVIHQCHVEVTAERVTSVPKVFSKIHLHFVVDGEAMDDAKVARAVSLSLEKYCSVAQMLIPNVGISGSYTLVHGASNDRS